MSGSPDPLGKNFVLGEAGFPCGHSCPRPALASFLNCLCVLPWAVPPSLLSSWLEPFMSPELLANLHRSTVAKNTLSRGLLFGTSLPHPPLPLLTTYKLQVFIKSSLQFLGGHMVLFDGWREGSSWCLCHLSMFSYGSGIWVSIFRNFHNRSNFFFFILLALVRIGSHIFALKFLLSWEVLDSWFWFLHLSGYSCPQDYTKLL